MDHPISRFAWRSVVRLWLANSVNSWRRLPVAHDSPHVHAPGANPDRILIAGDGASAGVGVTTHDLGLPGYLARNLTAITHRATDVDITVTTDMTASSCLEALRSIELSRYDVILLSLGSNESMSLLDPLEWSAELERLFDFIRENSPNATKTVMLSIPMFGKRSTFPRLLQFVVDRHSARLNRITSSWTASRANVFYLEFLAGDGLESDGSHTYEQWAKAIAPAVATQLAPEWGSTARSEMRQEVSRQNALVALGLLDMPPDGLLDEIATTAKDLFGTSMAGITFIDASRQSMASAIGLAATDVSRVDAFCDITIRRPQHFVIEDALLDPRYSTNPGVVNPPHIRFYAGYPIETPNGQRIGALCIMDTAPRTFTKGDAALLRDLAHRAQARLWALSEEGPVPTDA